MLIGAFLGGRDALLRPLWRDLESFVGVLAPPVSGLLRRLDLALGLLMLIMEIAVRCQNDVVGRLLRLRHIQGRFLAGRRLLAIGLDPGQMGLDRLAGHNQAAVGGKRENRLGFVFAIHMSAHQIRVGGQIDEVAIIGLELITAVQEGATPALRMRRMSRWPRCLPIHDHAKTSGCLIGCWGAPPAPRV